jgi:Fe(3+) dicitrate transport protein
MHDAGRIAALIVFLLAAPLAAQGSGGLAGRVVDAVGVPVPGATVTVEGTGRAVTVDRSGEFRFEGLAPGRHRLRITAAGYAPAAQDVAVDGAVVRGLTVQLTEVVALDEINVSASVLPGAVIEAPDVSPEGLVLAATSNVIVRLAGSSANLAEKTARQVFARVPGAFVYDMDGSGNQINIATRGLDPHRSWELNVRQNGVLLNSDLYGYPASHYSPPMEAIERIDLIRGTAALQYGSQYGGLVNYVTKEGPTEGLGVESINSAGSFGLLSTYNAVGGAVGPVRFYGYMNERVSDGFRRGSRSEYAAQGLGLTARASESVTVRGEVAHSTYVYRIPGALTDSMFARDPRMSTRARDYYNPDITVPSIGLDWRHSDGTHLSTRVSAVLGPRNSVTFVGFANQPDLPNPATGAYSNRQVDIDRFRSLTLESRLVRPWFLRGLEQTVAFGVAGAKNRMLRKQQGVGTGGSDFDLTVTGPGFRRDVAYRSQNVAVYVENLFRGTSRWTVVPGIRVELGDTRMDGRLAYYDPADTPREIDHRYALAGVRSSLELSDGAELYGGWSQAYRPQIMKDVLPASALERTDPALDDSRGWTAELGIRNRRGERVSYDLGVFELRIGDRFGTVLRSDPDGASYLFRTNVGTSRTRGVELSLDGWLLQRDRFAVWAHTATSYFDARYTAGTVVSGGRNVDIAGNRIESVPAWISRSGLSLEGAGFSASVLVSHTSSSYADALNTVLPSANGAVGRVPAYTLVDLNGSYQVAAWLRVRGGVNNLFDESYFTKRPQFYPGPGIWPSDGRGFQVTAELRRWP